MTEDMTAELKRLIAKDAITDCLHRYCRGVDRADSALMLSAYHPDAYDDHGVSGGDPQTFVAWALDYHTRTLLRHQHRVSNISIDLDEDTAHVESYYCFWGESAEGPPSLAFGRYVDRFERRDGRWAIAHRVCINEIAGTFSRREMPESYARLFHSTGPATRDAGDVSYVRPLIGRAATAS